MLQNACLLAEIGADTAENEQHFAKILPIGRRVNLGTRRRRDHTKEVELALDPRCLRKFGPYIPTLSNFGMFTMCS